MRTNQQPRRELQVVWIPDLPLERLREALRVALNLKDLDRPVTRARG